MRGKALFCAAAAAIVLCSCSAGTKPQPTLRATLSEYEKSYSESAALFGFPEAIFTDTSGGVCGFAAFDGLFVVCFETDDQGGILSADISPSGLYAKTLSSGEKTGEALIFAAYLAEPFFESGTSRDNSDAFVSTLAGVFLEALGREGDIVYEGVTVSAEYSSGGGFEIDLTPA